MMNQIYCLGYTGRKLPQLGDAITRLQAVLVDIRYMPHSRNPVWEQQALLRSFGDRYLWLKELGNRTYRTGGIQIDNYPQGKLKLLKVLDSSSAILMCACDHAETCHRTVVANLLRADGYTVTEYEWTAPPPPKAKQADQLSLF